MFDVERQGTNQCWRVEHVRRDSAGLQRECFGLTSTCTCSDSFSSCSCSACTIAPGFLVRIHEWIHQYCSVGIKWRHWFLKLCLFCGLQIGISSKRVTWLLRFVANSRDASGRHVAFARVAAYATPTPAYVCESPALMYDPDIIARFRLALATMLGCKLIYLTSTCGFLVHEFIAYVLLTATFLQTVSASACLVFLRLA